MVPVTSSWNAVPPAGLLDGLSEVMAGVGRFAEGAVIEKLSAFEVAAELETVIATGP